MAKSLSLFSRFKIFFAIAMLIATVFISAPEAWAKRPPEIRNQDDLNIRQDMHGEDLSGYEFVKIDLRGIDFSDSNLTGAVFNNSKLIGANLHGANLQDALAYASDFEDSDLSDANLSNSLLMESSFDSALIEGADFTNAVLSRIQQKQLCELATGVNSSTGVETTYSLGC